MSFSNRLIKSVTALVAIGATAFLAGCGGGGAKDPFDPGPQAPALVVNPTSVNVYSNLPTSITVTGVPPYQVFTSDAVVLPVVPAINGSLLTLTPSNVAADTSVTVTVQDALGRRVAIAATVKPATLVGSTEIVPLANNTCGGSGNSGPVGICSGDTATAKVTVRAANTSVIPNRQVRFDVIFGNFRFVTDVNGANPSSTVTLVTDQNGVANALIKAAEGVPSQSALIRVTDLVTGNRVDTPFTIVQRTNGAGVLSVVPGSYTSKAFYKGECGGTSGDFLVYGGRAPYTARSSLPNLVRLSVGGVTADPVVVANSGGRFTASTTLQNCVGYEALIVVTDADGRNVTVSYKEEEGANDRPTAPPPTALIVTPSTISFANCAQARTVTYSITGGTQPVVITTNRPAESSVSGSVVTLNAGSTGTFTIEFVDSKSVKATATISCGP